MATTINISTAAGTLAAPGEAWTKAVDGATSTGTYVQARGGSLEWCEAPTASAPASSLAGHDIRENEQQDLDPLASGQSYYLRAAKAGTLAVVTPGTAS